MSRQMMITGVVITDIISVDDVCRRFNLSEKELNELRSYGIIDMNFNHAMLNRLETALRLQADLDLNLAGVALALDLLDELSTLRTQLAIFRKQVD